MKLFSKVIIVFSFMLMGLNKYCAQLNMEALNITRQNLNIEKKLLMMEALDLSIDEGKKFWPLYNEFQAKLNDKQDKIIAELNSLSSKREGLTNKEALNYWNKFNLYQKEVLKLKKKYFKKACKVIPEIKAVRFLQTENKIKVMIEAYIAVDLPLLS